MALISLIHLNQLFLICATQPSPHPSLLTSLFPMGWSLNRKDLEDIQLTKKYFRMKIYNIPPFCSHNKHDYIIRLG